MAEAGTPGSPLARLFSINKSMTVFAAGLRNAK
jgi:hypothetical protein